MSETPYTLRGRAGTAEPVSTNGARLAGYLLTLPGAHPFWWHYLLSVVHLHDAPDLRAPARHFPAATHELTLFALDPETPPQPGDPDSWKILTPYNICEQFVATDVQIAAMARSFAQALVTGQVIAEPQGITGAAAINREILDTLVREGPI